LNQVNGISFVESHIFNEHLINKNVIFSKIPSNFIGEVVDLLDNNTLNLAYAKKVISVLFDETNKSPSQVCNIFLI
jgi:hypothetical protein